MSKGYSSNSMSAGQELDKGEAPEDVSPGISGQRKRTKPFLALVEKDRTEGEVPLK